MGAVSVPRPVPSSIPDAPGAYLFRDAAHVKAFFASDLGAGMKKMAEDQLGIRVLGPTYFGARQVGLKSSKKITTPAELYEQVRASHGFSLPRAMLRVAVNDEFRDWTSPLMSGDRVVFIPPVAGG